MDMEIKNRIEAFLSWKTSGVKPVGWDLEPQNKQEMWIAEEAKRLDSIEFGEDSGEKLRKVPVKAAEESNDYNELENIPILPIAEELIEGKYYYQPKSYSYSALQIDDSVGIGDILHFDTTKGAEVETYLNALPFDPQTSPMLFMMTTSRMNVVLVAADLQYFDPSAQGYGLLLLNGQNLNGFIYSTWAGTLHSQTGEVVELTVGFQENFLDENGNITLIYSHDTIASFTEAGIPELWNGVFIFKAEVSSEVIGQVVDGNLVPFATKKDSFGKTVYEHNIYMDYSGESLRFVVNTVTDFATPINSGTAFQNFLVDNDYTSSRKYLPITGFSYSNGEWSPLFGVYNANSSQFYVFYGPNSIRTIQIASCGFSDAVRQL